MALKFLNKKGWHTGSLRNIENVWKAEQKHEAEQRKLEELRKQIQEERERSEFRLLQEQAGLVPRQERLDFLYDSGLAVGKGSSSSSFKALDSIPKPESGTSTSSALSAKQQPTVPGALFEEKSHSTNDAWRKLHSDPLLLIKQKEQEALARIKNNPVQMAMIRKAGRAKELSKEKSPDVKERQKSHHHKKSKHHKHPASRQHSESHSENDSSEEERRISRNHKRSKYDNPSRCTDLNLDGESKERNHKYKKERDGDHRSKRDPEHVEGEKYRSKGRSEINDAYNRREGRRPYHGSESSNLAPQGESWARWKNPSKLSEEERAAKLREMEMDAELHEEQRWKRLRLAEEKDAQEVLRANESGGKHFLDAAQKSVFGTDSGGSATIEESVRRRTHYRQDRSEVDRNAFRRR